MVQAKDASALDRLSLDQAVPGLVAPTEAEEFVREALEQAEEEAEKRAREEAAAEKRREEARQRDKWPAGATGDLIRKAVAKETARPRKLGLKLAQRRELVVYMLQRTRKSYPWDGGANRLFLPLNWLTVGTNSKYLARAKFTLAKWQEKGYYHADIPAGLSGYLTASGRGELARSLELEPIPFAEEAWGRQP